jgi:molybdenum cofactor biosynthesis enzyme MoaA
MTNAKKIIAIRSLMCPDHAHNLPPTVLNISWMIGKRCNYDCSYCWPHLHDAVSPFVNEDSAKKFISRILSFANNNNKKIKWMFTGGEPFIDPGFISLVKMIKENSSTEQINVTTNGSMPLQLYIDCKKYFSGITISLHLERSEAEVKKTINKIIQLTKNTDMFINVNLMFLPGHQLLVENIIQQFNNHNIKFVLRKILRTDNSEISHAFENHNTSKKDRILIPIIEQTKRKQEWEKINNVSLKENNQNYYSREEMELLESTNKKIIWNNVGVWYNDNTYEELNTDYLNTGQLLTFKNWTCFAGVDQLFVDFDGHVYSSSCFNNGAIGHISDGTITFQTNPSRCITEHCTCNIDIAVRKSEPGHEHLIGVNRS